MNKAPLTRATFKVKIHNFYLLTFISDFSSFTTAGLVVREYLQKNMKNYRKPWKSASNKSNAYEVFVAILQPVTDSAVLLVTTGTAPYWPINTSTSTVA